MRLITKEHSRVVLGCFVVTLCAWSAEARQQSQAPAPVPEVPVPVTLRLKTTNETARAAFDAGFAAMTEGDVARAVRHFTEAYAADPQFQLARVLEINVRNGALPGSGDQVEQLRLRNGAANLVENLLFLYVRERLDGRLQANALLNAAARLAPSETRLLRWYHTTLAVGSPDRIAIARALRDRDPKSYVAHGHLALALNADSDLAERTAAMEETLRLGPERAFAHSIAGTTMARARRFDEAVAHFDRALRLDSAYIPAISNRATANLFAGRPADARRDFRRLEETAILSTDIAFARRAQALVFLHEGNPDGAAEALRRVLKVLEGEGTWRDQLGATHRHLALLAALKEDAASVERAIDAQRKIYDNNIGGGLRFANALALSLAGAPTRARQELTEYERLVAERIYTPPAGDAAAITAAVLVGEGKFDAAIKTAADSTNFVALLAKYQALSALGRNQDADEPLQRLLTASNYAADNMIPALARLLSGRK